MFRRGDRVHSLASHYDAPGTNNAWSRQQFGDAFATSYCYGVVNAIDKKNKVKVVWDLDGSVSCVH